jgi:hypothetical protein
LIEMAAAKPGSNFRWKTDLFAGGPNPAEPSSSRFACGTARRVTPINRFSQLHD